MALTLYFDLRKIKLTSFDYNILSHNTKDKIHLQASPEEILPDCSPEMNLLVVLTDTDAAILDWKNKKIPVIAWSHEGNKDESLMSAPYMILSLDALTDSYIEKVHKRFYGIPLTVAESERCFLRELTSSDLPDLLSLDEEQDFLSHGRFFRGNIVDKGDYLADYIKFQYSFYDYGIYGIYEKANGIFLGIAGFSPVEDSEKEDLPPLEIGYAISRKYRRMGYARECITSLLDYAENSLNFREIIAKISAENEASLRTAESCGLKIIKTKRNEQVR